MVQGDDNWSSRTYVSYGNPNKDNIYKGAFAFNVVEQFKIENNPHWNIELYGIYRYSQGAKDAVYLDGFTRENKKQDFSVGGRHTWFLKDRFHLLTEAHFQTRQYFTAIDSLNNYSEIGWGQMMKFSLIPTFVLPESEIKILVHIFALYIVSLGTIKQPVIIIYRLICRIIPEVKLECMPV